MWRFSKCPFDQLELLFRNRRLRSKERWAVVTHSFAVNDELKRQFGYGTGGHMGLMSGTVFRIYAEEAEYYSALAYGLLIPAYKYCVTLIERPFYSVHNYAQTSFGYIHSIDELYITCHRHSVVLYSLSGEAINIK